MANAIKAFGLSFLVFVGAGLASAESAFPTSSARASGTWSEMGSHAFTGDYDAACRVMGLTSAQCSTYKSMHEGDQCARMEVPDGVVLDALTFTTGGKHRVERNTRVALGNTRERGTEVCNLGGGTYAMRFAGCNNHAVVRNFRAPEVAGPSPRAIRDPYQGRGGSCAGISGEGRHMAVRMYAPSVASHPCAVQTMLSQDGRRPAGSANTATDWVSQESRFSRTCAQVLHESNAPLHEKPVPIEIVIVQRDQGQEVPVFVGTLTGATLGGATLGGDLLTAGGEVINIPLRFTSGTVVARFLDADGNSVVRSPAPVGVGAAITDFPTDKCKIAGVAGVAQ